MSHKFHAESKNKLDNAKRRELLPPEATLLSCGLHEGDVVADIGCGIGYFTIPAARIVGNSSKVYALDILPEMLQEVEKRAEESRLSNIVTVLTEENNLKIANGEAAFAFVSTVIHEIEEKERFINEIKRIIKKDGRIAVVEWKKENSEFGPPIGHRVEEDYVKNLLFKAGFKDVKSINIGSCFYAVIAVK